MRLIDADALIDDIKKHSASYFADDFAHEWVDKQPTIEPERKTGKWITQEFGSWAECSECHELYDIPMAYSNFCPNCGARLEAKE